MPKYQKLVRDQRAAKNKQAETDNSQNSWLETRQRPVKEQKTTRQMSPVTTSSQDAFSLLLGRRRYLKTQFDFSTILEQRGLISSSRSPSTILILCYSSPLPLLFLLLLSHPHLLSRRLLAGPSFPLRSRPPRGPTHQSTYTCSLGPRPHAAHSSNPDSSAQRDASPGRSDAGGGA